MMVVLRLVCILALAWSSACGAPTPASDAKLASPSSPVPRATDAHHSEPAAHGPRDDIAVGSAANALCPSYQPADSACATPIGCTPELRCGENNSPLDADGCPRMLCDARSGAGVCPEGYSCVHPECVSSAFGCREREAAGAGAAATHVNARGMYCDCNPGSLPDCNGPGHCVPDASAPPKN